MSKAYKRESSTNRRVFSRRGGLLSKGAIKESFEIFFLFILGIATLTFINWLPQSLDWEVLFDETISDLLEGFSALFRAFLTIGGFLLSSALAFLGILLIIAALWRFIRLIYFLKFGSTKYKNIR